MNGAIVEKDFIVYQFDRDTNELLDKRMHWRPDVPEKAVPVVAREQAEFMAEGEVRFAELYIISPDSDVFPLDPSPQNPCWVVRSVRDGDILITIVDAETGRHLGYGVPPPQNTGFAMSGAQVSQPCQGAWTSWYRNAEDWFEVMGYPTATAEWPADEVIMSHVQSTETAVFYEIGHSHLTHGLLFCSGCQDGYYCVDTTAEEIETWITGYTKMPFTFLASCYGMCATGPGTLSHAFRKASSTDTATVGYCDMSEDYCFDCWVNSLSWQTELFANMANGDTVADAYDKAMAGHPMCAPAEGWCMRFTGDESFATVPVVSREVCAGPAVPAGPEQPGAVPKNRYLSFVPGNPGQQTALRVTPTEMPEGFEALIGRHLWVGEPRLITEQAGTGGDTEPTFLGANLQCTPAYTDFGVLGTVCVFDDAIVPSGVYDVQAIIEGCAAAVEPNYSEPLGVSTSGRWGDVTGGWNGMEWLPPDGTVDFTDITAVVEKFRNLPDALTKARADLVGEVPDSLVDFMDISAVVDGFKGFGYPYAVPEDCP